MPAIFGLQGVPSGMELIMIINKLNYIILYLVRSIHVNMHIEGNGTRIWPLDMGNT